MPENLKLALDSIGFTCHSQHPWAPGPAFSNCVFGTAGTPKRLVLGLWRHQEWTILIEPSDTPVADDFIKELQELFR